jgi:predicted phosphodiesterase
MIAILGDIHFNSSKDYWIEVSLQFLKWFENWQYNNSNNELILAGDLVHSSVNGGVVISFLEKLANASRFAKIHIVVGNHDIKRRDGIVQLAYEFLRERDNVLIYDRMQVATIQSRRVLMMPHYIPEQRETVMKMAYSNAYKVYADHYDLVVGHFLESSVFYGGSDSIENLSKLDAKHLCLGHVHNRVDPRIYIGSVFPCRHTETDTRRAAWILLDDTACTKIEDPLPIFCEFASIRYPEAIPATAALVPIYTITNCASEAAARSVYKNIYIRKVITGLGAAQSSMTDIENTAEEELNAYQLFTEFLKLQSPPLERSVVSLCRPMLENSTNLVYGNRNSS